MPSSSKPLTGPFRNRAEGHDRRRLSGIPAVAIDFAHAGGAAMVHRPDAFLQDPDPGRGMWMDSGLMASTASHRPGRPRKHRHHGEGLIHGDRRTLSKEGMRFITERESQINQQHRGSSMARPRPATSTFNQVPWGLRSIDLVVVASRAKAGVLTSASRNTSPAWVTRDPLRCMTIPLTITLGVGRSPGPAGSFQWLYRYESGIYESSSPHGRAPTAWRSLMASKESRHFKFWHHRPHS